MEAWGEIAVPTLGVTIDLPSPTLDAATRSGGFHRGSGPRPTRTRR
jgi:hypothetical protein